MGIMPVLFALLLAAQGVLPAEVEFTFSIVHDRGALRVWLPYAVKVRESDPPNEAYVTYSGNALSEDDLPKLRVLENRTTFVFEASGGAKAIAVVRDVETAVWKLARDLRGFIVDEDTNQIFSPDSFHRRRLEGPQSVMTQMVIQSDERPDGLMELKTAGMAHFGLPDLGIAAVPLGSRSQVASIINLAAQTLAERPELGETLELRLDVRALGDKGLREQLLATSLQGATHLATVKLSPREDGVFWFDFGSTQPQVEQAKLSLQLFGGHDEISRVSHEGAVKAVSKAARKRLLEVIRPRWSSPAASGKLLVKAPFDGREWMWVEVLRWKGDRLEGVLDNTPELVSGLQAGSRVAVRQDEVFDYMLSLPDGGVEGNTTADLLRGKR